MRVHNQVAVFGKKAPPTIAGMYHLSRGLHTAPLPVPHAAAGNSLQENPQHALNEVESNPSVRCNLPDRTSDSMLSDFTSHQGSDSWVLYIIPVRCK